MPVVRDIPSSLCPQPRGVVAVSIGLSRSDDAPSDRTALETVLMSGFYVEALGGMPGTRSLAQGVSPTGPWLRLRCLDNKRKGNKGTKEWMGM